MSTVKERFLVDDKGNKTAVVLDIEFYRQLQEDLADLSVIAERRNEPTVPLKEVEKRLKRNGLI